MEKSNRSIPYVDLAAQHRPLRRAILEALETVLTHGQFVLGPEVERFEAQFAELCGVRYALGVGSGTDAIRLALGALGIGPGDEVITAPNSFIATISPIVQCGARPVFADVGEDYNVDPACIEAALTHRTKAILPVHLTGRPARMERIAPLAEKHGLALVEDCAQAILASCHGKRVGAWGHIGCFSLHPLKTLNACGDGGVLTTSDPELYERLRVLRNNGLATRDSCVAWSGHSRLDTLQAAILLVKLPHLATGTESRRANAALYRRLLAGIPEIVVPGERDGEYCVYHTFVVQAQNRDGLRAYLSQAGIGTAIHYPSPLHLQPVCREQGYRPGDFPECERQAKRILSLPVHTELTEGDIVAVAEHVRTFYGR